LEAKTLEPMPLLRSSPANLTGDGGDPEIVGGVAVTGDFFRLFGVSAAIGRALGPEDDRRRCAGDDRLEPRLLATAFRRRRFGERTDPGAVLREE
jgi:hypothetical protein